VEINSGEEEQKAGVLPDEAEGLVREMAGLDHLKVAGLMTMGLSSRSTLELNMLKDRSPPFVLLSDGSIRNGYTMKLVNKATEARELTVKVSGVDGMEARVVGVDPVAANTFELPVAAYGVDRYRMIVESESGVADRQDTIKVTVTDPETGETFTDDVAFHGGEE
jgi:hypothetical protein